MIRLATIRDLPEILEILKQSVVIMRQGGNAQWDAAYPDRARFEQDIAAQSLYLFETDGGAVAGFVCANAEEPEEYDAVSWSGEGAVLALHRMAVGPAYRGRGVARALLAFCEDLARTRGAVCIHTDTNTKNTPVNTLLQTQGYRFTGTIVLRENPDRFNCYEKLL